MTGHEEVTTVSASAIETSTAAGVRSSPGIVRLAARLGNYLKCILRIIFVLLNNTYCIPTYLVWMIVLFPMKIYQPSWYWRIEGMFFHWLLAMVSMWTWSAGYDVVELGDDISKIIHERTLVIANHQSTGDVPILMTTFNAKPTVLPNLMWIMDSIFKFTNFGLVSLLHHDFFILSGRKKREESLRKLDRHLKDSYIPLERKWLVLFPEGGFLCKRRETSQKYAKKNNLPILENVTLPRVGALQTIFNTIGPTQNNNSSEEQLNSRPSTAVMRPEIRYILDITIAYPQGKPIDLPTIITGVRPPCQTILFYRIFPTSMIPKEPEQLSRWLFDRWAEKEVFLENFYKYGSFNGINPSNYENYKIQQDPLRFLILHLFFITSSYLHYKVITYVLACIW
ncbi:acyl-CoA:lysophosphatidylglycerol acyltransferase 1 [Copidosoma floridanum]|uniref:acyl-CoA:lysophosphatidylglycerol acyltransferase 1 n=1 Tax=Copidosoma floridanum TaxID=29053 RepID=UPI0006C9BDB3|nr:acyl-CoA:lysophosphatidylglycerol acyltransferase 1 [Copidosoma floridanum]XP_014216521.1 acyl-CoA:lysophosphatidylglycerol acyltransferase 1 [Copidosoma floridanum]XP_014216522.1 acyl-CoA:lysophosphatidylglycerol acyltransferase 1 [Copidosoma floridanum]XP_014216523.1 acyl-CoA:lysophosphatidylglycerol acyltransferase 1 [Copidosoma floridanum]XP_014216524.1 acyl-CoA:lysophosphatidylglycerol acyltransferase 1 [Copidosoma floridanum]